MVAAGNARAATPPPSAVTCAGHADRGLEATLPDRIDVAFGCSGEIKAFTVISGVPIGEFAVSAEVYDHTTQAIVEADSFFCEGLIPRDGFNCAGIAHAGKDVKTSFETRRDGRPVPAARSRGMPQAEAGQARRQARQEGRQEAPPRPQEPRPALSPPRKPKGAIPCLASPPVSW